MEKRKIQSKKRYLLAFLIGTAIFILIFALSYAISYLEFRRISNLQVESAYEIFHDKLYYSLFDEQTCTVESFDKISSDLDFQGKMIDDLEKKFGKDDENVLFRKKFYTLIELEHFEFINLINERCDRDIKTILFFYSNLRSDLETSEEVGRLLTVAYNRNENLMIYSFDINLYSDLIEKLKEVYDIEKSSTLIINGEVKVENPQSIFDIEKHLSLSQQS
jgi:hypothetical protein